MDEKIFLKVFGKALKPTFTKFGSGWLLNGTPRDECTVGLVVYKARWGRQYKFMLKIFVDGAFGFQASEPIDLRETGHVFRADMPSQAVVLDLDSELSDAERLERLQEIVDLDIVPFARKSRTISGLIDMAAKGEVYLLPAVQSELWRLKGGAEGGIASAH